MSADKIEMRIERWPDRKRPTLCVYDGETNITRVLAYFRSDVEAEMFLALAKRGIQS